MKYPDYIIIGAQRSGTTSLHNWLGAHPDIADVEEPRREIHFFNFPQNYCRGVEWYAEWFAGKRGLIGEKSPTYLDHPLVPARAKAVLPDVRLIAVLRNPVDRAYSHFWKSRAKGFEPIPGFAAALMAEDPRLTGEQTARKAFWFNDYYLSHHHVRGYKRRGMYAMHLSKWLEQFPADQLHVIKSEQLFNNPIAMLGQTCRFLNVRPVAVMSVLRRYQRLKYPPMPKSIRGQLEKLFAPHNLALAELLDDEKWLWK